MKKIIFSLSVFLFMIMVVSFQSVKAAYAYELGDGTIGNPYQINSIEDLYAMRETSFTVTYYQLMTNLDFNNALSYDNPDDTQFGDVNQDGTTDGLLVELTTEMGWLPMGDGTTVYAGVLDGNGFSISNLYINRSTDYVGFFGRLYGYTIAGYSAYDVSFLDVNVTGHNYVGAVVGSLSHADLGDIYVTGQVNGYHQVGGVAGTSSSGEVTNAVNKSNVTGNDEVGGILGDAYDGNDGGAYSIVNYGTIIGVADQIGGLIGYTRSYDIDGGINHGDVTGGTSVGGIVGFTQSTSAYDNVYNTGTISAPSTVGGIFGSVYYGTTINNAISFGIINSSTPLQSSFFGDWITGTVVANNLARFDHVAQTEYFEADPYGTFVSIENQEAVFSSNQYLFNTFFDFSGMSNGQLPVLYNFGTTTVLPNQDPIFLTDFDYKVEVTTDVSYASNGNTITIFATFNRLLGSAPTIELISPEVMAAAAMVVGVDVYTYEYEYTLSSMDTGYLEVTISAPVVGTEVLTNGENYITDLLIINQDILITSSDEVNNTGNYQLMADLPFKEFSLDNGVQWTVLSESVDNYLFTGLSDGTYTLVVKDIAGNISSNSVNITVDTVAPDTLPETDIPVGYVNTDVTVTISGSSDNLAIDHYEYKINDGAWQIYDELNKPVVSGEGETSFTYKALDAAGNESTEVMETIYIDKTAPVITGVEDELITNQNVTPVFNEGTALLNGNAYTSGAVVTEEGLHTLIVTDVAGNEVTLSFTIDKTMPVITGVVDEEITNQNTTPVFNEGTATLNGTAYTSGTVVTDEGSYTLVVTDEAGNVVTLSFIIDKTAPMITGVVNEQITNQNVTPEFNEGTALLNGTAFTGGTQIINEGSYTLVIVDEAGNEVTLSFTIDKTAPVISGIVDETMTNQNVTPEFNEGTALLNGTTFTSGTMVSDEDTYILVVTDEAGNEVTLSFTIDKTVPMITGVVDETMTNQNITPVFNEGTALLNGSAFTSGTEITEEGSHTLVVTDEAGNEVTLSFTIDKTTPTINNIEDGDVFKDAVTINFDEGTATLNGEVITSDEVITKPGVYELVITDDAGNTSTVTFTIEAQLTVYYMIGGLIVLIVSGIVGFVIWRKKKQEAR